MRRFVRNLPDLLRGREAGVGPGRELLCSLLRTRVARCSQDQIQDANEHRGNNCATAG